MEAARNSASIEAFWSQVTENPQIRREFSEAVAAYAASLAFAGSEEKWAADLAVQAGLVTYFTSLDWDTTVWLGEQVDWNSEGSKLVRGKLDGTSEEVAEEIMNLADEVADFVDQIRMSPLQESCIFAIALTACSIHGTSKWATRVYRKIMRDYGRMPEFSGLLLIHARWITDEWRNSESIINSSLDMATISSNMMGESFGLNPSAK